MALDYSKADRLLPMKTVQRETISRADALRGGNKASDTETPEEEKTDVIEGNVVLEQMAENKAKREYEVVLNKVSEACSAARESCQDRMEGVQSKKERKAILTETLNDLISAIEKFRDDPKSLIAAKGDDDEAGILLP